MRTALWLIVLSLCCVSLVLAQVPRTIGYQGILTDTLGNPKPDGRYSIAFRFYDTPVGKVPIWEEVKGLDVRHGLFSTRLGDQVPFPAGLRFDRPYFLALVIDGGPELAPRLALNAVGYSLHAVRADTAENVPVNSLTGREILDGTIGSADISDFMRTVTFPAQALNVDPSSNIIRPVSGGFGGGLQWGMASEAAHLPMPRPMDWDGVSDVVISLWFTTPSAADGTVNFFVRPRVYSPGDTFRDVTGTLGTPVTMAGLSQLYLLIISIPAARFGNDPYWHLVIQRDSTTPTYRGDVIVSSVNVSYVAVR